MTENMMSTEDKFTADVTLRRNDAQHRYELLVGGKLAVQSFYRDLPGHIDFSHTETSPDFEGQGLGKVLGSFRTARSSPPTCVGTRAMSSASTGRRGRPAPV
jgi:hypothetical protein